VTDEGAGILNAVTSMDVLPAGGGPDVRGPRRWDEAERAMRAFADAVQGEGLTATLFIAPEAAGRLAEAARDLAARGFELGALCHPQLSGYQACLGSYNYDRQREIVGLGRKVWQDALGSEPSAFRAGFFSANDYTFHVLCVEGYRQGSCSLPGRIDNAQCSLWFPSYPFPHHTDPLDRSAPGTMEFYEVPVTSDFEAASRIAYETYTPPHLRVEDPDVHSYARDLVERQLERMREDQVDVRAVHFVTGNIVNWGGADDPHVERLQNLCAMLREVAGAQSLTLRPTTLTALHASADELYEQMRQMEEGK
jgi:hypothetical protein